MPDKFGSSDEDEDDDEGNWIGEYGAENQFDRVGAPGDLSDPFGNTHAMDFDSDDEEGVDEETWNSAVRILAMLQIMHGVLSIMCSVSNFNFCLLFITKWPTKPVEQNGVPAQLEAKLVEQSEDLQGVTADKTLPITQDNESVKVDASESKTPTATAASAPSTTSSSATPVSTTAATTGSNQGGKSKLDEPVVRVPAPVQTVSNGEAKSKDVAANDGDKVTTESAAIMEPVKLAPQVQAPPPLKKFVPSSKQEFSAPSPSSGAPSVIRMGMEVVTLADPVQLLINKTTPTPTTAVATPSAATASSTTTPTDAPKTLETKKTETATAPAPTITPTVATKTLETKTEADVKDTTKQLDALKLEK